MAKGNARSRTGFWVLIGLLAASGVAMALIVVFGLFESIAYSIVWRVFVADLYLIASLAAQHAWLRWATWIATGVTFLLGVMNAFWRYTPYYRWADGRTSYTVGDSSTGWSPWMGFNDDLEAAAHLIVVCFVVLGFVSLAHRWVAGERVLSLIYRCTFGLVLASAVLGSALVLDTPHRWNLSSVLGRVEAGIVILALTAAAIVIIGAFVQRRAALGRARAAGGGIASPGGQFGSNGEHELRDPAEPRGQNGMSTRSEEELRARVRSYVDEYLAQRGL